ncbi:hypothetical protein [Bradyrhizobium guangdongense]|uniref:hypothetical protein n=1 Tax=Bradyrhizobium guangdongense TaxID=1325090 RepID=UPI001642F5F7|nr:hypothetical protein [Bradyrhizobium guangdongense]
MYIPSQRDLEFLLSLRQHWRVLYWRELARLLAETAVHEVQREAHAAFWRESTG